ncbi:MAG: aminotransferase class I/II-fold pyridoxal phosphate-dependent enzyme [Candidatus Eisenbacteria bacterium]|nr:aminotransferase class I/II-fold pyridoxal phosphate-dependent enzyme [Candidatus Eisenbacteria bacterium]
MSIPLIDLKAQYRNLKPEIDAAMAEIVENTAFIGGPAVADFEREFAAFCEVPHAVGAASGTAALHLALCGAKLEPGDEVVTVTHTFIATAEVARLCGARIKLVDIHPQTYCMDPESLAAAIGPRTRVVIPVHLYGHPADMDALDAVARAHDLFVIEDAAQAHGARYKGTRVGGLAPVATFSFYPGKNLGAYGDAGGLTTQDPELAEHLTMLANHGRSQKYGHLFEGFNYRLDAIQAAVLRVKLRYLEQWNARRREIAARYDELLAGVEEVTRPYVSPDVEPVYHLYVVQVPDRDRVTAYLREHGVMAQLHYPVPLHLQPAYEHLGLKPGSLPVSERVAARCISLPIFPEMTEDQIQKVARTLKDALAKVAG